jgi:3-oxoacyl-[acyl-carrier protein] reductase
MNFDRKVVLVTGAGRGVGREIALSFSSQGAYVAANDITPINLDKTIEMITTTGGVAKDFVTDISKKMPVQSMVDEILDLWGHVDFLVNNAGVEPHIPLLEMDAWDWQRTLDVNLSGAFYTTQVVGRVMRAQGRGAIVNIASLAGRAHGLKDRSAYIASQLGLIGLSRAAARELAADHIRVNAVCPGVIATGMTAELRADELLVSRRLEDVTQELPGQPQDIAGIVVYLCSDAASHITGQAIKVESPEVMD